MASPLIGTCDWPNMFVISPQASCIHSHQADQSCLCVATNICIDSYTHSPAMENLSISLLSIDTSNVLPSSLSSAGVRREHFR